MTHQREPMQINLPPEVRATAEGIAHAEYKSTYRLCIERKQVESELQ